MIQSKAKTFLFSASGLAITNFNGGQYMNPVSSVLSIDELFIDWLSISRPTTPDQWDFCSIRPDSPISKPVESIQDVQQEVTSSSDIAVIAIASMPREPTPPQHFFTLRLDKEDETKIQLFIKDLAEKSFFELGRNSVSLNQRGLELKEVHPMRFIGHILSNPTLSAHLNAMQKRSFVYGHFVKGFTDHMKEKEENLLLYAPGFACQLDVEVQSVIDVITSKKYIDLMHLKKN